jgi:rod shape-determining protein MreB
VVPLPRPRVIVGIPTGVTEVEKRAVYDAVMTSGARQAFLIEEPIAAALGAGLPVGEIRGSMVIDIGGGTTEVAVMSSSGVVVSRSLRVAGDEMDEDVISYLRNKYNLLIGQGISEQIKWNIGSAYPLPVEKTMDVRGRNLVTGLPETVQVSSVEMREALSSSVQVIVDTVRDALDEIPPEIVADLMDVGICLAGGGALLQGLAERLSDELKLRVWVAEDPLTCVVRGAGLVFEDFENLSRYLVGLERGSTRHTA